MNEVRVSWDALFYDWGVERSVLERSKKVMTIHENAEKLKSRLGLTVIDFRSGNPCWPGSPCTLLYSCLIPLFSQVCQVKENNGKKKLGSQSERGRLSGAKHA